MMRITDEFYKRCVDLWGTSTQCNQAIEELAELIGAINKQLRSGSLVPSLSLIEEIADVEIMLGQLKYIFQIRDEDVDLHKHKKICRLCQELSPLNKG